MQRGIWLEKNMIIKVMWWHIRGKVEVDGIQGPKFFYSPHKAKSYIDAVIKQNKRNNNETGKAGGDAILGPIFIIVVILLVIKIFT